MWYIWVILSAVTVASGVETEGEVTTTPRPSPHTLDRQAGELAWRNWLQSPENGNLNQPPRRITTKSLFITPLVCPKGQRLDRDGCVQVLTVNKDDHERVLLEQLNALFQSSPSDMNYDYGEEEPGPLQLSIPIGLEPQASPLFANEPSTQAQQTHLDAIKVDKKEHDKTDAGEGLEAELELMKLQSSGPNVNITQGNETSDKNKLSPIINLLSYSEKPKRDSTTMIETTTNIETTTDVGQKEQIYGHVNVDTFSYGDSTANSQTFETTETQQETTTAETETPKIEDVTEIIKSVEIAKIQNQNNSANQSSSVLMEANNVSTENFLLKDKTKLNPESDYADIGEAIKIISRYAEVTTDDSFAKDFKKFGLKDTTNKDDILGTRTKLQYRNKSKQKNSQHEPLSVEHTTSSPNSYAKSTTYYRYPWVAQNFPTPPPDYPFRHLQDYWPGKRRIGELYNALHENPRRHHHSFPQAPFRDRALYLNPLGNYGAHSTHDFPPDDKGHAFQRRVTGSESITHKNQDLYSLLGLRHWFSTEGATKR